MSTLIVLLPSQRIAHYNMTTGTIRNLSNGQSLKVKKYFIKVEEKNGDITEHVAHKALQTNQWDNALNIGDDKTIQEAQIAINKREEIILFFQQGPSIPFSII